MMTLLASALVGVAALFGGALGHHGGHMSSTTPSNGMASSTINHQVDLYGKVTAIQGDTLTVVGRRENIKVATSTFTIDATNARILKFHTATSSATTTVADIHVNDYIRVHGIMNGAVIDANVIVDGVLRKMHSVSKLLGHTATSTPQK